MARYVVIFLCAFTCFFCFEKARASSTPSQPPLPPGVSGGGGGSGGGPPPNPGGGGAGSSSGSGHGGGDSGRKRNRVDGCGAGSSGSGTPPPPPPPPPPRTRANRLNCEFCRKEFDTYTSLRSHRRYHDERERRGREVTVPSIFTEEERRRIDEARNRHFPELVAIQNRGREGAGVIEEVPVAAAVAEEAAPVAAEAAAEAAVVAAEEIRTEIPDLNLTPSPPEDF